MAYIRNREQFSRSASPFWPVQVVDPYRSFSLLKFPLHRRFVWQSDGKRTNLAPGHRHPETLAAQSSYRSGRVASGRQVKGVEPASHFCSAAPEDGG